MDLALLTVVSWGDRCPAGMGTRSPQAFHSPVYLPTLFSSIPLFFYICMNSSPVLVFSESPVSYQVLLPLTIPGQL